MYMQCICFLFTDLDSGLAVNERASEFPKAIGPAGTGSSQESLRRSPQGAKVVESIREISTAEVAELDVRYQTVFYVMLRCSYMHE